MKTRRKKLFILRKEITKSLPKYLRYLDQALKDDSDFNSLTCLIAQEGRPAPGGGNSNSKCEDHKRTRKSTSIPEWPLDKEMRLERHTVESTEAMLRTLDHSPWENLTGPNFQETLAVDEVDERKNQLDVGSPILGLEMRVKRVRTFTVILANKWG